MPNDIENLGYVSKKTRISSIYKLNMFKYAAHFVCALLSWGVCRVIAESENPQCPEIPTYDPLKDREEVCLVELSPVLEHIANQKKLKGSTIDSRIFNETQAMLDRIESHQGVRDKHLKALQSNMEGQLKVLQAKIAQNVSIISLEKSLLQAQNALQCSLDSKKPPPSGHTLIINVKFEKMGKKLIYIEKHIKQNWFSAASKCREMGGKLLSPQNETELSLIRQKLDASWYWLDYCN